MHSLLLNKILISLNLTEILYCYRGKLVTCPNIICDRKPLKKKETLLKYLYNAMYFRSNVTDALSEKLLLGLNTQIKNKYKLQIPPKKWWALVGTFCVSKKRIR